MRSAITAASSGSWVTSDRGDRLQEFGEVDRQAVVELAVEARQGFVEQHDGRLRGERAGECDPLGLAPGEFGDASILESGQADAVEPLAPDGGALVLRRACQLRVRT